MPKTVQHPEILVQARRGGTVESLHRACAALAGPDGEIVERWGDPGMVTYWRSSAKPLQAQTWLADGTVGRFGWGSQELAIMSASHDGLDFQADLVRRMLADLGLTEQDLRCDSGLKARHNCSGNHTGFLAACVHHGWDVPTYQRPDHPAQRAALEAFAALTGLDGPGIATGIDGCGIVCYATPVTVAAATYALLPELLPEISAAMRAHPELVEGPRPDRHRGHARAPRRDQQVRRRGTQLLLAAGRARARRQGRRRRRPRPRAGRARRPRGGRRRRRDERRAPPARPAADQERRRRRRRRAARGRPGVTARRRPAGAAVLTPGRRPSGRPGPYVRRGGAPQASHPVPTDRAPPERPPAQPSSAFGLRRRTIMTMATTTTTATTTTMTHVRLEVLLLSGVVSAAFGATLK